MRAQPIELIAKINLPYFEENSALTCGGIYHFKLLGYGINRNQTKDAKQ